jgi:S-adenosyl-L-methionine hydrolase (adenosine-forming)
MRTLVTLTTDFGTRDSYVAQLKGVLYSLGPDTLSVVDLSHEIEPQNVREAALFVRAAWPRFPQGTVHLVVVDPGVGSARRALAARCGGQLWLGPDNGVLWPLLAEADGGGTQLVALELVRLGIGQVSATFHGRDLFAPAVAQLTQGRALEELGEPVRDPIELTFPRPVREGAAIRGEVIHIDRFGNLITNLTRAELGAAGRARLGGGAPLPLVRCYADAEAGALVALIGSSELLEIALRDASAARATGAQLGAEVSIDAG